MKWSSIISALLVFLFVLFLFFPREIESYPKPLRGKDSDGTPSEEILKNMENGYEMVILKAYPFGYLEIDGWERLRFLKKAIAIVEWKTYKDLGAGNIYIGYSFDGKNYVEVGPFNESENFTKTILTIPVNFFSDLNELKVRFRGEDLDFAVDAVAEVSMELKVKKYKFGLVE